MKRIAVVIAMIGVASLWIIPIHEVAHEIGVVLAGLDPAGIDLGFSGPILVGSAHWKEPAEDWQVLAALSGPWILLYIPGIVILWLWRRRGMPSLLLAILVGQGGLYTALGLIRQYGDSEGMVHLGVPILALVIFSVLALATAGWGIMRYIIRAKLA